MRKTFVKTENALRFLGALDALTRRGAEEACLAVVDGEPGLGKTATVTWWAVQNEAVLLRAKQQWTPSWALRELLFELGVQQPAHSFEKKFRQVVDALKQRARIAEQDGRPLAIVIDEVDYISRRAELLETFRDFSDLLEIPVVFVGMGRVRHNLTRFPQVASRVAQFVEFTAAPLSDVRALVNGLCEVPVADDLAEFLHRASGGKFREVKEGIAAIERFGLRNPGRTVDLKAMAGETLLNDRGSGKPILVRAA